jgi:hypothetical protein
VDSIYVFIVCFVGNFLFLLSEEIREPSFVEKREEGGGNNRNSKWHKQEYQRHLSKHCLVEVIDMFYPNSASSSLPPYLRG